MASKFYFLSLCFFVSSILAQAPENPLTDFCRRYGQQTTVIDDRLYIDGGWVYANPISQNPDPVINQGLLYDNLELITGGMPTQYANLSRNSSIPDVAGGILWADEVNKIFYLYGGEFSSTPQDFQLWGYDVILNQWNLSAPSNIPVERLSYGAGVAVSELALGFYYGGYLNNRTNPLWGGPQIATSNLLQYDMIGNSFTNNTAIDSTGRAEGTMVYIPASGSGLLIYFGGVQYPYGNETEISQPMDEIIIYEIAEGKWYRQQATGDIPPDRRKSCGGAAWPKDQSSYNIYIYGGFGFGENATGFDDVWILTMPAFEWIKWYPDTAGVQAYPHGSLTCNVVNNTQMIVMGGNFTFSDMCDAPTIQGQHNLNLGQNDVTHAKWAAYQTNITGYDVPADILKVTGGTSQGGASVKAPSGGWGSPDLSVYFAEEASFTARNATRTIPTPTSTPTPPPTIIPNPPHKKSSSLGPIAGGVVGGIVLLAALALLAFCLIRKKRRTRGVQPPTKPQGAPHDMSVHTSQPYESEGKYSVLTTSHPTSPPPPSASPVNSYGRSSSYTTPPPQHANPNYHPAHVPPPMPLQIDPNAPLPMSYQQYQQNSAFYPPPEAGRPEPPSVQSHEMPTIRSPEVDPNTIQPIPLRGPYGSDPK